MTDVIATETTHTAARPAWHAPVVRQESITETSSDSAGASDGDGTS